MKERLARILVKMLFYPYFFIIKKVNREDDTIDLTEEIPPESDYIRIGDEAMPR